MEIYHTKRCALLVIVQMQIRTIEVVKLISTCHGNPATHEMGLQVICTTGGNAKSHSFGKQLDTF